LLGAVVPLVRYLRERRPISLLASLWPLTVVAILAARIARSRTRVVVSDHNTLSRQYGGSWRTMATLKASLRLFYPLAAARVGVSEGVARDLASLSGLAEDQFTVIRNPVPEPPDQPSESSAQIDELWAGTERRILTVGRLKAQKNHKLLIRSFALLDDALGAKLLILGEGPLRPELEQLATDLGIADRVILPGFSADPWSLYRSADLFVLSSDYEGLGNVLIEAMLAGLPVVSTDCPSGPREILDGGRLGELVPVGDTEALATAMTTALTRAHDPEPGRRHAGHISAGSLERYQALMAG
jgi:glycosyltransferase involved in cell wall biosynthesis